MLYVPRFTRTPSQASDQAERLSLHYMLIFRPQICALEKELVRMSSTASGSSTVTASVLSRSDSLDSFPIQTHIDYFENSEADKIKCALRGIEAELVELVLDNASPSVWMDWLRLPLECATSTGSLDSVKRLLGAGVSWKAAPHHSVRPGPLLHTAAASGNEGVVEELVKAGAEVDAVDKQRSDRTALHVAAAEGAENSARALIGAGAVVDARDSRGWTPLHVACLCGHRGVVVFLLLKGADALKRTMPEGDTPLHLAASSGHEGVLSDLLAFGQACVGCSNLARETALHVAARAGHLKACITLLRAGASSGRLNAANVSPLDVAALCGHSIRLLNVLTAAESQEDRRRRCSLALYFAVKENKPDAVMGLVMLGANVDRRFNGLTCLHYSAQRGHYAASEALLRAGADVDARTSDDLTPLHQACMFSRLTVVELLIQWNANELAISSDNYLPGDVVGIGEITIESSGDQGEDPMSDAIKGVLARAPADRVWRRRGWLVMCRQRWLSRIEETRSSPSPVRVRPPPRKPQGRGNDVSRDSSQTNGQREEKRKVHRRNGVPPPDTTKTCAYSRNANENLRKDRNGAAAGTKSNGITSKSGKGPARDTGQRPSRGAIKDRPAKKVTRVTLRLGRESWLKDGVDGAGEANGQARGENARFVGAVERLLLLREGGVFREILTFL